MSRGGETIAVSFPCPDCGAQLGARGCGATGDLDKAKASLQAMVLAVHRRDGCPSPAETGASS